MAKAECAREQDLLDTVAAGRWPAPCDDDLRSHVERCAICADILAVVPVILEARDAAFEDIRVPASGTVWWRAQIRARQHAARQAARPITVAEGVATVVAVAALVGGMLMLAPWLSTAFAPLPNAFAIVFDAPGLPDVGLPQGLWRVAALILGLSLLVAPLAIYIAVADE